ncbi:hypothetical protein AB995_0361 [Lactococcus cremoris]|nr:hypothetical protein AB995_0361 [Lactococcus cremoris]
MKKILTYNLSEYFFIGSMILPLLRFESKKGRKVRANNQKILYLLYITKM